MKRLLQLTIAFSFIACTLQAQQLPQKSPHASVSYVLGVTEIKISYSSPAVRDRDIWGAVVPYNEVWRAGANEATLMHFSTDVSIEGESLAAGTYSFFLTPTDGDKWMAHFNSDTTLWGAYGYDASKDVVSTEVEVKGSSVNEEWLNYTINEFSQESGYIRLAWEKKRIYIRVRVKTVDVSVANVDKALTTAKEENKWQVYASGAQYLADAGEQLDKAMEWAKESVSLKESFWNYWVLAQVQAKAGDTTGAIASAEKSLEVGNAANEEYFGEFKEGITKAIDSWKDKP